MKIAIQFFAFLLFGSISLVSCEKDDNNTCNVSNPVEEIAWLKEAIDNVEEDEYSYYVMANYKGETVFYYVNCHPLVNYASFILNCNGDNLGYTNNLQDELTNMTILWKHEASKCDL
jgi:hypothetical protein